MKRERWRQIEKLYQAGLRRNGAEREAFLEQACEGDDELRREVQSLLEQEEQDQAFLESPALDVAAEELAGEKAPSLIGKQIGSYRVLSLLGKGGMGEVYLVQDETLDRKAALKFLPPELEQDATARRRFLREAKSAAALDHPFICHIHEIGETDGAVFIAMEYVPGERLDQKLAKGPLPLKDALERAVQIAEALEAAHKHHIVHRDLKPSNILLTPEGHAKVMDFGLAKRVCSEDEQRKLRTDSLSQSGITLGTLPYMSPEQLRCEAVDTRSDLFSFGVVLYEMLTGVHPFQRPEAVETGHAILNETPAPLSEHLDEVPVLLQHTLSKLLAKAPERRYQHIGDVRVDLKELIREVESPAAGDGTDVGGGAPNRSSSWRKGLVWAGAILAVAAGILLWVSLRNLPSQDRLVTRLVLPTHPLALWPALALSPDGERMAYVSGMRGFGQIYLRHLGSVEASQIPGADKAHSPFFSPDGDWVGFFSVSDRKLKRVSVSGGSPLTICDLKSGAGFGGSWGTDDRIIFSSHGLWSVSAEGGEPQAVSSLNSEADELDHFWPQILPGGQAALFTAVRRPGQIPQIWVQSLETGQRRLLVDGGVQARYLESGHLAYAWEGSLLVAPFDLERLEVTRAAVPMIEDDMMGWMGILPLAHFAVSETGTLAYLPGPIRLWKKRLVWVDREGKEELLEAEPRFYQWPRISPDGAGVAVSVQESGSFDVWIYDLTRRAQRRLTFNPAVDGRPMWSPDGRSVIFRSSFSPQSWHLFRRAADGTGQAERLTSEPNEDFCPWFFTPDGRTLAFTRLSSGRQLDVHLMAMEAGHNSKPLLQQPFDEGSPELSPDGRWIAYRSFETRRWIIEVRPFPNVQDGRWQVSREGCISPLWAPDGRELFFEDPSLSSMMVVSVETQPTFSHGKPRVLFRGNYTPGPARNFDISPDGKRFLMIKDAELPSDPSARDQLIVVLNWFEELKRLVPRE